MSLEMSKFFAGVQGEVANPPQATGRCELSTLHQQVDPRRKRQQTSPAANATSKRSVMRGTANCKEGEKAKAPTGSPGNGTPSKSTGTATVEKCCTKGQTKFSRYKTGDGASPTTTTRKQHHLRKCISSNRCRRQSPGTDKPSGVKWIMKPMRNFKFRSDSSSEGNEQLTMKCLGKLETASPNLTVKTSWPDDIRPRKRAQAHVAHQTDMAAKASKHSRVFRVPSQRIMLVDQLKQAQVRHLKAKRVRSQYQEQQHSKQSTQKHNGPSLPDRASLLPTDDVVGTTSVHNSETENPQLGEDTSAIEAASDCISTNSNSSSGSYQTTIVCSSTSCHQSDSFGKMWSGDQKYDTPIIQHNGNSKSIKLTSTVIKIMPESAVEKTPEPPLPVRPQVHAAVRQLLQLPKRVAAAASPAPLTQLQQQSHPQSQSQSQPQPQPQSVCLVESPTFASTPKIVRVQQHKVPRTMEDGIDMSYQGFVSTPLKRGKRPQTIRYLYRPMVRSLNNSPASSKHTRKSKKNQPSQTDADNNKKALQIEMEPLGITTEVSNPKPEPEAEMEKEPNFKAPPLKIDAKYRTWLEKLTKMPFPNETAKEYRTQSGSGDAHLNRLALPPVWIPARKSTLHSQNFEPLPPLVDYHPNATRLDSKSGAYISYHAPLHFQRMTGGAATDDSSHHVPGSSLLSSNAFPQGIAAVTYQDIEMQMHQHQRQSNGCKCVSFQLTDPCSSNNSTLATNKKRNKKKKSKGKGRSKGKNAKSGKSTGRK